MSLSFAVGLFWSAAACCFVAQLLILRSIRGGRFVRGPALTLPSQRASVELFWAFVPAIALFFLLMSTWHAMHRDDRPSIRHTVVTLPT